MPSTKPKARPDASSLAGRLGDGPIVDVEVVVAGVEVVARWAVSSAAGEARGGGEGLRLLCQAAVEGGP